jgi:hypothetical protein
VGTAMTGFSFPAGIFLHSSTSSRYTSGRLIYFIAYKGGTIDRKQQTETNQATYSKPVGSIFRGRFHGASTARIYVEQGVALLQLYYYYTGSNSRSVRPAGESTFCPS